ncbi:hypothetical protein TWF506_011266 [Arthrobotrys conoides]|uniref:Ankyrin n=1 Tax=Arthrobotrys conoides TaxID=74498 RepID=A0AAN8N0W3_9PEZI
MIDIRRRLKRCILTSDLLVLKRLLQSHPKSLNFCDPSDHGNTPLHLAASRGQTSIVTFLVQAGHEKEGVSRNYDGQTPLMVASGSNDENADDVVFYLAGEFEGCVEWRDKSGLTALSIAAKAGNDANINILLDSGADINAVDPLGNTPLHYASAYGHLKAMRTLMDRGANFDVRNREGWYPKDYSYSKAAETYFKTLIDGVTIKNSNMMGGSPYTPTASNPFAGLMGPGGISSSVRTAGNFISGGGHGFGGGGTGGGAQTAPSSRDGSKRPSTAGSFSYGSHSIMGGSTATLVPNNTGGMGGAPMLPSFAPAMGQLGSTITLVPTSGSTTPMDHELPPPPSRVLKSAASMVEFSRMDRGSMTARPGTPQSTYSSNMGEREFSSPLAGRGGEREGRADGGRHSATGSVSSYASVGSVGSMQGGGLPVLMQGQQMQQMHQMGQMGLGQGQQQQQQGTGQPQQRALYEAFTKLRPRASSNG